jgi:hypothetical protein
VTRRSVIVACCICIFAAATAIATPTEVARFDYLRWHAEVVGRKATVTSEFQITILSPAGKEFGEILKGENRYFKIRNLEYRLVGPNGKPIQKLEKKDLTKACGFGADYILYTDICSYFGEIACPSYPAVIQGEVTLEYENASHLTAPALEYKGASITNAELSISFDNDQPVAWKLYGLDTQPEITAGPKRTSVVWKFAYLPLDPEIEWLPPSELNKPSLKFGTDYFELERFRVEGRTWQNLGIWYNQMAASQYLPPETAIAKGTLEDARQIFLDLTRSTRYVAVEVGLSGMQPYPAQSVASKGYGDCKGLSTLLISRLRNRGIKAYPILVRTSSLGPIDSTFAKDEFNHVIACAIDGADTLWLDPTCSECLPGDLPAMDESVLALLVDETGGVLIRIPQSPAADNVIARNCTMRIDDPSTVILDVTAKVSGNIGQGLRGWLRHARSDQLADFTHDYLVGGDRRFNVITHSYAGIDSLEAPMTLIGQFASSRPLDRIKQTAYVNPFVLVHRVQFGSARLEKRDVAVAIGYACAYVDSVNVIGPFLAACDSVVLPTPDSCSYPGGKIVVTYSRTANRLLAAVTQEYSSTEIPPSDFPALQNFISTARKLLDRPIKLYLKSPSGQ